MVHCSFSLLCEEKKYLLKVWLWVQITVLLLILLYNGAFMMIPFWSCISFHQFFELFKVQLSISITIILFKDSLNLEKIIIKTLLSKLEPTFLSYDCFKMLDLTLTGLITYLSLCHLFRRLSELRFCNISISVSVVDVES